MLHYIYSRIIVIYLRNWPWKRAPSTATATLTHALRDEAVFNHATGFFPLEYPLTQLLVGRLDAFWGHWLGLCYNPKGACRSSISCSPPQAHTHRSTSPSSLIHTGHNAHQRILQVAPRILNDFASVRTYPPHQDDRCWSLRSLPVALSRERVRQRGER